MDAQEDDTNDRYTAIQGVVGFFQFHSRRKKDNKQIFGMTGLFALFSFHLFRTVLVFDKSKSYFIYQSLMPDTTGLSG